MYVTSLVTEHDVIEGGCYRVVSGSIGDDLYVTDDVGDVFALFAIEYAESDEETYLEYRNQKKYPVNELSILREQIEALQEENAELKFRLASLEK